MVDLLTFSSPVTQTSLATAAARSSVCSTVLTVLDGGPDADLSDVVAALGVLAGGVAEPAVLLSWELARTCAAIDAAIDGYGVGERPLADDAAQVWVSAAADAMADRLGELLEGRDPGEFLVEVFSAIDAVFGEPEVLPLWRTELRDAFCDADAVPDGSVLLSGDQSGLWEMLLCVEYARVGSFDVITSAMAKAGPGTTLTEVGPFMVAWYALGRLAYLVTTSAVEAAEDAGCAEVPMVCVGAFGFYDATIEALTD